MIINNKKCITFDIEVLPNVFTCTTKDTETNDIITFEISYRRNDRQELCDYFLSQDAYFVGYNNHHFDDPIVNYIIDYRNSQVSTSRLNESIYNLSYTIVKTNDTYKWKRWKYSNYFKSIDLMTHLFSSGLRVGLKTIQITLHFPNVQEFQANWDSPLPHSRIDELIDYNINDVESTSLLLEKVEHRMRLREKTGKEYGIDLLSVDDVNLGMKVLASEYMRKTGIPWNELKEMRSPADTVDMQKVISPLVKYDNPILQRMLSRLKNQRAVSPGRHGYEDTFIFGGMKVTLGVGGIHGDNGRGVIIPADDELLLDWDVASLYPSFICDHKFYPPHLGEAFWETYCGIRTKRFSIPKSVDFEANTMLKFALNGLTGNLQQEFSWVYSPFTVMQIRMNGQLFLLMLCEKLLELGCSLKQINTDGVLFIAKKSMIDDLTRIKKEWENYTLLRLEEEDFLNFYQSHINGYFGKYRNGEVKMIGPYRQKIEIGRGLAPKIITKAVMDYFLEGIEIEDTIKGCENIQSFLESEKVDKDWDVTYMDKPQQRLNRFYISTNGYYLWKSKDGKHIKIVADYGVTIHNKFYTEDDLNSFKQEGKTFKDIYNIDYRYYIAQARKLVEQLKPRQLSLW